jgi:hypothetical protein
MDDELERVWKETVMAYFMVLSRHLLGEAEESHENRQLEQPVDQEEDRGGLLSTEEDGRS